MRNVLSLHVCLILVLSGVDSCIMPSSLYVPVPETIPHGYEVTKVSASGCDPSSMRLIVKDQHFIIKSNGAVVAEGSVYVPRGGRTFSVLAQDNSTPGSEMEVHLVPSVPRKTKSEEGLLKRSKRRWSPPPINILENDAGPYPKQLEKIVSDTEVKFNVYYTLTGAGVDKHPVGLFSLERDSGMLTVYRSIDREEFPNFVITANVYDIKTNQITDQPLDIYIEIDDVNDNSPVFTNPLKFTVLEQSIRGTVVGKVNATDRDKPNTLHAKIKYSLLTGMDLFSINSETGVISTITNNLDREQKENHLVIVQIKDMDGAVNGLFTTGTATIALGDINDNPPTFTKASYEATVQENEKDKLILRIPVEDKDLINTPNWKSKFVITKGNENGNFRIDTDPKTNEGLLYVVKPLDYEQTKSVNLVVSAQNEAALSGTTEQWKTANINVGVSDVDEGPEFTAPTIRFIVKENTPNGTIIGTYSALDPETKSSNGIKYYKTTDPAGWVTVDRNTGELRVANTIDRESPFALNGTYNVIMRAVDASSKTGTGTVIIQVEDVNDNIPEIPTSELVLCEKDGVLGSVLVVAEDKDQPPFSSPFTFSLPKDNDGKWTVTALNGTSATLKQAKELPTGLYNIPVDVKDLQGSGKTQTAKVRICQCKNGVCLAKQSSVTLGPLGILALLLPLALLLLLCLLLAFFCVTKGEKLELEDTGDSGGILLKSNTEGRGEEVDPSLIAFPMVQTDKGLIQNSAWPGIKSTSTIGGHSIHENGLYKTGGEMREFTSSHYDNQYGAQFNGDYFGTQRMGSGMGIDSKHLFHDAALNHTWQTNGRYLHQKLGYMGTEEDGRYADDIVHSYKFEGRGSAAGSVGCCSECDDNENLDFLNTLGPKFKTLADACSKR